MDINKPIKIRAAVRSDCEELHLLLNDIIRVGGSTAMDRPLSVTDFENHFLSGDDSICCHAAVNEDGELVGFQSLKQHSKLPKDWADIATFAKLLPKTPGVGTTLFQTTLAYARQFEFEAINATIRADNVSGLAYYSKMGFIDYTIDRAAALSDGAPVDRISKKLQVK
ncbi:MAG: L-amino acid N-acyltransferase YncA [Gammaproteobacteria bacterium]|jgi:L-amino acid N-acyltransferase YncA